MARSGKLYAPIRVDLRFHRTQIGAEFAPGKDHVQLDQHAQIVPHHFLVSRDLVGQLVEDAAHLAVLLDAQHLQLFPQPGQGGGFDKQRGP